MQESVVFLTGRVLCDVPNSPRSRFLYRGVKLLRRGQDGTAVRCAFGVYVTTSFSSLLVCSILPCTVYISHLHSLYTTARFLLVTLENKTTSFSGRRMTYITYRNALLVEHDWSFSTTHVSIRLDHLLPQGCHRILGPAEFS